MANKGEISIDSEDEIREIEKELEEELRYAVASAKGVVPADAVLKIERKRGRPTGGLSSESKKAGGKNNHKNETTDMKGLDKPLIMGPKQQKG